MSFTQFLFICKCLAVETYEKLFSLFSCIKLVSICDNVPLTAVLHKNFIYKLFHDSPPFTLFKVTLRTIAMAFDLLHLFKKAPKLYNNPLALYTSFVQWYSKIMSTMIDIKTTSFWHHVRMMSIRCRFDTYLHGICLVLKGLLSHT